MPGCCLKVVAPGLICSPGTRSCSGPFPFPRPAPPEGGFEPLASLPAGALPPCSQLLSVWVQRFSPAEQEEETSPRRGSDSRARVSATNVEQPRAAPRRRALLPGTTFHSHGARRGADAGPHPRPLLSSLPPARLSPRQHPSQTQRRWRPLPAPKGQRMEARASPEPADPFLGAPPGPRKTGGCGGGGGEGSRHNPFLQPAWILASLQILK